MLVEPAPNVVSVFPPGEWVRLFEQLSRYQVPRYQYVMIAALATALAISDVDVDVDVDEKMVQACLVPRDVDVQEHDGLMVVNWLVMNWLMVMSIAMMFWLVVSWIYNWVMFNC